MCIYFSRLSVLLHLHAEQYGLWDYYRIACFDLRKLDWIHAYRAWLLWMRLVLGLKKQDNKTKLGAAHLNPALASVNTVVSFSWAAERRAELRRVAICPRQLCSLSEAPDLDSCNSINYVSLRLNCGFTKKERKKHLLIKMSIFFNKSVGPAPLLICFPSSRKCRKMWCKCISDLINSGDVWSGFRRADLSPSQ